MSAIEPTIIVVGCDGRRAETPRSFRAVLSRLSDELRRRRGR